MSTPYNLYNFEAPFKNYLLAGKVTPLTVKNYLSDFRHFAGWMMTQQKSEARDSNFEIRISDLEQYKSYLIQSCIPVKTINRRLSTLRKFGSFCISQGWMKENVAKKVTNVILESRRNVGTIESQDPIALSSTIQSFQDDVLRQFQNDPAGKNINIEHINEFFSIINS